MLIDKPGIRKKAKETVAKGHPATSRVANVHDNDSLKQSTPTPKPVANLGMAESGESFA